jgi:hypothetical protein
MIVGGVVVVALLLLAWMLWGTNNSGNPAGTATTTGSSTTGSSTGTDMTGVPTAGTHMGSSGLTVPAVQDAGLNVRITSATVAAPTWVVVYESSGSQPGRALGATLFFPENNGQSGIVSLLRATQPGQTYFIGENADTGNDRVFSLHGDQVITGADGKPVWYTFKTR